MKRVLLIAHAYPPWGGSAVQRTLSFSRYLPANGWEPQVLTINRRAHPRPKDDLLKEIPKQIYVKYAFGLDASRHLSVRGRYPGWLALPDRWVSWWFGAVPAGLMMIKRFKPHLIWSTYPISTAHLIGITLHRITGLPWIADFRDPMTEPGYPADPKTRKICSWIERRTIEGAARNIFTTPGALQMYATRYPEHGENRWQCIPNGYDEEIFNRAEQRVIPTNAQKSDLVTLIHSGELYPSERDPTKFFSALAELRHAGGISPTTLRVVLRLTGHDDIYAPMLKAHGLDDMVSIRAGVPYTEALGEMLAADGLLVFQASNCNRQIPAKLYEYLRAKRPVFALTDPNGNTAQTLISAGIDTIVRLDDKEDIKQGLIRFLELIRNGAAPVATDHTIQKYSRESLTKKLAETLSDVLDRSVR